LGKHGFKGSYLPAFLDEIKSKETPEVEEMADMFLGMGLINEAKAVLLEELILEELGFDPEGYTDLKKEANPYCKALEKRGKGDMLRYIENWRHPHNYRTSFMKTFLRSFGKLKRHGFSISKDTIISAIESPDEVESGNKGRKIAQKIIDEGHVIRIIYEDLPEAVRVITFYPGRRERYET
jgi:hypothetical protein